MRNVFERLDLGDEWWVYRIVVWSKGSVTPYALREEWTLIDVLRTLDMIDAMEEISFVQAEANRPRKGRIK